MKLAIALAAAFLSVPAVAADSLPPLKLQIHTSSFDGCDDVCELPISPRIVVKDRKFSIPGYVRPLNTDAFDWYQIPLNTSFDWYSTNVLGNVYGADHLGVIADVNWDGYEDQVFLMQIDTPKDSFQLISVWLVDPATGSYWTHAEHLNRLYEGIEVDDGEIFLTSHRKGRWVLEPYHFPLD